MVALELTLPYLLYTDVNMQGVGALLAQVQDTTQQREVFAIKYVYLTISPILGARTGQSSDRRSIATQNSLLRRSETHVMDPAKFRIRAFHHHNKRRNQLLQCRAYVSCAQSAD
eukprot:GHVP01003047.1.p1 GENE.GHVP01003047.1~~GHVP01003047.1.p1  ORF type:complete len:114 (+),score=1.31 GHVP01003047.1:59-400(+)